MKIVWLLSDKKQMHAQHKSLHLSAECQSTFISARINRTTCLDTRQPGTVFRKLGTRQSEILTNFLEIARLIPLRT